MISAAPQQSARIDLGYDAWVDFKPNFFPRDTADAAFRELVETTAWETHRFPRLVKWFGDFAYEYSGVRHPILAWTPRLSALRTQAEQVAFGASRGQFQGVLLNYYRDGRDGVGFHADDEKTIRICSPIVSMSFGAMRRFIIKPKDHKGRSGEREFELTHGSVLVMGGTMQQRWVHTIPKAISAGPRINLTFRQYTTVAPAPLVAVATPKNVDEALAQGWTIHLENGRQVILLKEGKSLTLYRPKMITR